MAESGAGAFKGPAQNRYGAVDFGSGRVASAPLEVEWSILRALMK